MRAVNLLPRDDAKRRTPKASAPLIVAGLLPVVVGAGLMGLYKMESATVADRRAELALVEQELERIPPPVPVDVLDTQLTGEKNKRIEAVADALSRRVAMDRLMREISLILPEDVWLQSLTARSDEGKAFDAGTTTQAPAAPPAGDASTASTTTPSGETTAAPATPAAPATTETAGFLIEGYTYSQEGVARLLARLSVVPHLKGVRLFESHRVPGVKRTVVQFQIFADLRSPKETS